MFKKTLTIALAFSLLATGFLCPTISVAAESNIKQVRYSVNVDKIRDKFVYVLEINQRLAIGQADATRWKILEFSGEPVKHSELGADVLFYWLDEFNNLEMDIDRAGRVISIDTKYAKAIKQSNARSGAYLAAKRPEEHYTVSRDWGTDFTYRLSFASQDMTRVRTQSSSVLGLNMGRYGRFQATVDTGESDTSGGLEIDTRNIFYEVDTDSGYEIKLGDLNTFGSGNLPGVHFLGMHIGSNLSARNYNYVAGRFGNLESVALLSRPATVEIAVNDRVVSTITAGVGSLSVHDIPLDDGLNIVDILLTYADGSTQTVTKNLVSGGRRIGIGRTEHYLSLGVLGHINNHEQDANNVWLGASLVHGLTSNNTVKLAGFGRGGDSQAAGVALSVAGLLPKGIHFSSRLGLHFNANDGFAGTGGYWTGFLEKTINRRHFSLSGSWSDSNYLAITQTGLSRVAHWTTRVSFSHSFGNNTAVAANISLERQHDEDYVAQRVGVRLQRRYKNLSVSAAVNYQQTDTEPDLTASLSVRMPFGDRQSQRLNIRFHQETDYRTQTIRASKTIASRTLGSSWNAELDTRQNDQSQNSERMRASAFARLPYAEGSVTTSHNSNSNQTNLSGWLAGSIVHTDNNLYFTHPVSSSFVLVDTDGTAPVELTMNGLDLGAVNSNGKLLIPAVASHSTMKVKIKPGSLPGNFSGKQLEASARFARGLGHLYLPVVVSRQATATLMDRDGNVLPAGSIVSSISPDKETVNTYHGIVAKNGRSYLSDLAIDTKLIVNAGQTNCTIHIKQQWPENQVADLGNLTCH